jgi:hypothetical protein
VANGSVHSLAQSLREVRWENLAQRMKRQGNQSSREPKIRPPT